MDFPTGIIETIISLNFSSRSAYHRNPLCYIRHTFLLSNTIKTDTAILAECCRIWGPTGELFHCSPREESRHICKLVHLVSLLYVHKRTLDFRDSNTLLFRKHWNWFWNAKHSITFTLTRHKGENCNTDSYGVISFPERHITSYLPLSGQKIWAIYMELYLGLQLHCKG